MEKILSIQFENSGATDEAVLMAWTWLESLGFSDYTKPGDKAPRWVQWTFVKTEKGWLPAE